MFTNMVQTDGYGIDFILAGPRQQQAALPDLDLNDFTGEEINQRFHLWGVDPGLKTIFTASNGHGEDPHQTRLASIETFALYVHSVFNNLGTILPFYDDRFTSLRFLNYIGRQRANAEIINMFVTGGKKYLKREFKQRGNDPKRGNPKIRKKRKKERTEGTTTVKDKGKKKEKTRKKKIETI
ncbi:hypothetical protein BD770DRAFT_378502 [Pilaira anomala]|nr:hypothetical protein BD770DRAFT_378502 [Pilaira anomala]